MENIILSEITGVVVKKLTKHVDNRGWLLECFRQDEIDANILPVMSYISVTDPSIARGPHEHIEQTDYFCFIGSTTFTVYLWDNRESSPTYKNKEELIFKENEPAVLIVPPGVVHAYKNTGTTPGFVLNFPNKLYAGKAKKEKVDEVRHESDPESIFKI